MSLFEGAEVAPPSQEPEKESAKKAAKVKNISSRPQEFGEFKLQPNEVLEIPSMSRDNKKRIKRALELGILSKV